MNREIKFRAWDKKKNKMGKAFSLSDASYEGFPKPFVDDNGDWDNKADIDIMQYTNLKDKNGKEIWEGDIVKYYNASDKKTFMYKVEYSGCGFSPFGFAEFGDEGFSSKECEVIGNMYENPELSRDAIQAD